MFPSVSPALRAPPLPTGNIHPTALGSLRCWCAVALTQRGVRRRQRGRRFRPCPPAFGLLLYLPEPTTPLPSASC